MPSVLPSPEPEVYLNRLRLLVNNMELSRGFFPRQSHPGKVAIFTLRGNETCQGWRRFCRGDFVLHEVDVSAVAPFPKHESFMHAENVAKFIKILEDWLGQVSHGSLDIQSAPQR